MNARLQQQQRRFMRPDAGRYLRPDIGRYLAPERKWDGQPRIEAGEEGGGQFTFGAQNDLRSSGADRARVQIDAPMWYDGDRNSRGDGDDDQLADDAVQHLEEIVVSASRDDKGGVEGEAGEGDWTNSSDDRRIGHNSKNYLQDAPEIPQSMPSTREARMAFVRAAASWLVGLSAIAVSTFFGLLNQVDEIARLSHMIRTANDPPSSLEKLQRRAQGPGEPGYENHHIVNQHRHNLDKFGDSRLQAPENVVRIPQLKHIELSRWYATKNPRYGGRSPQEVLRSMSWEEQTQIGLERLRYFKVLE
jgi:hypothetical protein